MYDELIKNLRHDSASALQNCEFDFVHAWMLEAADAIEDLEKAINIILTDYTKANNKRLIAEAKVRESEVDNINLTGWLAEEHAKVEKLQKKYDETQDALITSELTKIYLSDVLKYIKLLLEKGKDRADSEMRSIFPMQQESEGE